MEKKPSWDDITSLKLEMDDGTFEDSSVERRGAGRLSTKDIKNMLPDKIKVIPVQVATREGVIPKRGVLEDIHDKGMCFAMPGHGLKINDRIMIGSMISKRTIKTQAIVRWQTTDKAGVEFIDPNEDDVSYLKDLYSAKAFNYRI